MPKGTRRTQQQKDRMFRANNPLGRKKRPPKSGCTLKELMEAVARVSGNDRARIKQSHDPE